MKTKTKKIWKFIKYLIKTIYRILKTTGEITFYCLKITIGWLYREFPKTKKDFSTVINWILINFILFYFWTIPVISTGVSNMLLENTPKPIIITKFIEKYIEVPEVIVRLPLTDAEARYYNLLENNKAFRNYVNSINVPRNNPGNLECKNQPRSGCKGRFATFQNIRDGFRALVLQCELDQNRNETLREFMEGYAPHFENDTEGLIEFASEKLNLEEGELINYLDTIRLAQHIAQQEHGVKPVEF